MIEFLTQPVPLWVLLLYVGVSAVVGAVVKRRLDQANAAALDALRETKLQRAVWVHDR